MKKLKYIFMVAIFGISLAPSVAFAGVASDLNAQLGAGAKRAEYGEAQDPRNLVEEVIKVILELTGTIFLVLIIIGGFHFFTSAGDEEKATKGKAYIRNSTIGLAVVLASYSITLFVVSQTQQAVTPGGPGSGPRDVVPPGTAPGEIVMCCDVEYRGILVDDSETFIVQQESDCYSRCDRPGENGAPTTCVVSRVTKNECVNRH
ncbi:hypothetical protein H6758_02930 [Candidatus Nomurabacteria bacterium]|nr:hypothetical protein [Candidatus Nomurabacteria bacterium]